MTEKLMITHSRKDGTPLEGPVESAEALKILKRPRTVFEALGRRALPFSPQMGWTTIASDTLTGPTGTPANPDHDHIYVDDQD